MLRILALTGAVVTLAPASAQAVIGEEIVPYADAAVGVTVDAAGRTPVVRFARTETGSTLWSRIAGRRTSITCDSGPGTMSGVERSRRERRRRVRLIAGADNVCTISTKRQRRERRCYEDENNAGWCIRSVVALTDAGRDQVLEAIATWDLVVVMNLDDAIGNEPRDYRPLEVALGERLVRLPDPSSTPPPGTIGLWERAANSEDVAVVTVSATGERLFVSWIGGVISTNAPGVLSPDGPSLFP
jgi:hypothetical protein